VNNVEPCSLHPRPELLKGVIMVVDADGKHCTHCDTRNSCKTLVSSLEVIELLEKSKLRWKEDVRKNESQGTEWT
jgi:hypothetical protein